MPNRIIKISIHAPREGGDLAEAVEVLKVGHIPISIHAPREGGDVHDRCSHSRYIISIHAPREGGDQISSINPI